MQPETSGKGYERKVRLVAQLGSDASECVWVTKTTFGQVEFLQGQVPVKYPGAAKLALKVRAAVEVPAR